MRVASPEPVRSAPSRPGLPSRAARLLFVLGLLTAAAATSAQPLPDGYDPSWYDAALPWVKIGVTEDGIHQVSGSQLAARGVSLGAIEPSTLKLYERGAEIPLWFDGDPAFFDATDRLQFVGRRNTGEDEDWAYYATVTSQNQSPGEALRSSDQRSAFTDTTYYWLTWTGAPGLRYENRSLAPPSGAQTIDRIRQTFFAERANLYYAGDSNDNGNPYYTHAEDYYWYRFNQNSIRRDSLILAPVVKPKVSNTDVAFFEVGVVGGSAAQHRAELRLRQWSGYVNVDVKEWTGYGYRTLSGSVPMSELYYYPDGAQVYAEVIADNRYYDGTTPNQIFIDWIRVTMTRHLSASPNRREAFPSSGAGAYHYSLGDFGSGTVVVLDPHSGARFEGVIATDGRFRFGDENNPDGFYWAARTDAIFSPANIEQDQISDWANPANAADYVIVAGPALRSYAQQLADFHTTQNGYTVVIADVQDLYDQFDYGRRTPVALRRFFQQTRQWATAPRFGLLWGDSRYVTQRDSARAGWQVPTYGYIGVSDNWFVQGLGGHEDRTEFMALGRIPVRGPTEAQVFLDKMQTYHAAPPSDWQQRLLYLTGGDENEQLIFQNHSRNWARIAADIPAGMDTLYFFKNSDTILDTSLRDSVRVAIRRGASLMSYFGHSSANTWEIVTDPASEFDNAERLPLVLSFGCRTGAFAGGSNPLTDLRSLAESLLLDGASGAIGHWGSSELGTITDSRLLAERLHQVVFEDTVRTLGEAIMEAKNRFVPLSNAYWAIRHSLQYNLVGDPAVQLQIPDRPDLHLEPSLVQFEPRVPLAVDSTITVTVDLRNRGYYPADSVSVSLLHTAPDGASTPFEVRLPRFALSDTLSFSVPIQEQAGQHRFLLTADPAGEYDEMREDNNVVELTHLVFSNGLSVVSPVDYGIADRTPQLRVSLAAQVSMGTVPVRFELDTVPTFDSPDLRSHTTTIANAHADWEIATPLDEQQVYYWRARIDDGDPDPNWAESSFTVSAGDTDTYRVMQRDALWLDNTDNQRLEWTPEDGWAFVPYQVSVFATSDRTGQSANNGLIQVNAEDYMITAAGFGLVVLDGDRGTVRFFRSAVTYENTFGFHVPGQITALQEAVDQIEPGDYFFVRTWHVGRQAAVSAIQEEVKQIFRDLGSTAIDTLTYDEHVWLLKGRLGDPSELEEMAEGPDGPGTIEWTHKLVFSFPEGETTSPTIGPARAWDELTATLDLATPAAAAWVDVLSGDGTVLLDNLDLQTPIDLSAISADEHPYLQFRATLADSTQQSTPQLERWRIDYTPVPELVVDGTDSTFPDELQEGEPFTMQVVIRNLSDVPADTARISVTLTDDENDTVTLADQALGPVPADGVAPFDLDLDTRDIVGTNTLFMQTEQPERAERIIYNNALLSSFSVTEDRTRPVMTVTVDDQMLDNAPGAVLDLQSAEIPLVSATPRIEVVVNDENPYLRLDDPSTFQLTLDQLVISPEEYTFVPATPEQNEARLLFEPDLTGRDTVHTVTVRAFDATGNLALVDPMAEDSTVYQVHFRIQNELEVESLYPYPNPMSQRTRLMFRMRGANASLAEDFRIRIYTVSGRLVRELDLLQDPSLLEAGGLRIGWNSVPWDGTDEDGDPVASGVYLYKVFLRGPEGDLAINNPESIDRIAVIR